MHVVELKTNKKFQVEVVSVSYQDSKRIKTDRFFFDWSREKKFELYQLRIKGSNEPLGLISLERIPVEWRVHIRLLTVSIDNVGKEKKFDRICGNLISYAARIALIDYGQLACVSLKPKSEIVQHYMNKYQFKISGVTLSLQMPELFELLNKYQHGR